MFYIVYLCIMSWLCEPHRLIGSYKDCMECHVCNDFLLIWLDMESDAVEIVRVGSHSELFG